MGRAPRPSPIPALSAPGLDATDTGIDSTCSGKETAAIASAGSSTTRRCDRQLPCAPRLPLASTKQTRIGLVTTDLNASEPRLLSGRWHRVSDSECAQRYPAELTVGPGSRYLGIRGPDQGMLVWDAGTARMTNETTLVMSTSSDELVSYLIEVTAGRFRVTDPDGCMVAYERQG